MRKSLISKFVLSIFVVIVYSCAQRGMPEGGPKDEDAPVIVSANPDFGNTNFKAKKIKINFNEYIKLKDLNKNLIISPPMQYKPIIYPQGAASKFINIKIIDTLKENTTYTISFGNSIVDNNEGNQIKSFQYIFSTGSHIDSLVVKGSVEDAFEHETPEDISIFMYEMNEAFTDSIIYKEKPNYIGIVDSNNNFSIQNVKEGRFLIIAIQDANNNYLFDPTVDKIGFIDNPIETPTDSIYKIKIFKETIDFKPLRIAEIAKGYLNISYQGKKPENLKLELMNKVSEDFKSYQYFDRKKDTIHYWFKPFEQDSLTFKISNNSQILDTLTYKPKSKDTTQFVFKLTNGGILALRDSLIFSSTIPISKFDKSKITLIDQDSNHVKFKPLLSEDQMSLKIRVKRRYNQKYNIELLPGAIETFYNIENDSINKSFSTKSPEDYGTINLIVKNKTQNSPNLILELLNKDYQIVDKTIISPDEDEYPFKNLPADKYIFRVIFDTNNNKYWDSGNYLNHIFPERVIYYHEFIELRSNWEINETFEIQDVNL